MEETMLIKRKDNGENQLIKASRFNPEYHELIDSKKEEAISNEDVICEDCKKEFKNVSGLKNHKKFCKK